MTTLQTSSRTVAVEAIVSKVNHGLVSKTIQQFVRLGDPLRSLETAVTKFGPNQRRSKFTEPNQGRMLRALNIHVQEAYLTYRVRLTERVDAC